MEYIPVIIAAFGASLLTFFSGFGLGTMLTPVFLFFLPIEFAVAATAMVHFANNLFKLALIGKYAVKKVIIRFGIPAIVGALIGALLLSSLANADTSVRFGAVETTILNMVMGSLIALFALTDLAPQYFQFKAMTNKLTLGGLLSGFFGGLSGHQGALRSAFLIKFDLGKEQFVATGTFIACMVDVARISTYFTGIKTESVVDALPLLSIATAAALAGALAGRYSLRKITIAAIQKVVGTMMLFIGILLFLGVL